VSSNVVRGDLRSPHVSALHCHLQEAFPVPSERCSIEEQALGTLPEDGNVMPKHVGATTYN
jgi:hypothetical protein